MKRNLLLPFLVLMTLGVGAEWVIEKSVNHSAVLKAADSLLLESGTRIRDLTLSYLDEAVLIATSNAALVDMAASSEPMTDELGILFWRQLKALPSIDIVSIGLSTGEYVEAERLADGSVRTGRAGASTGGDLVFSGMDAEGGALGEGLRKKAYDPRRRPWYIAAEEAGRPSWTPPYEIVSSGELVMTATVPAYVGGRLLGVSTADVRLGRLSAFLSGISTVPGALALIVDGGGRVLSASESSLSTSGGGLPPAIEEAAAAAGSGRALSFRFGGSPYRAVNLPLGGKANLSWRLFVAFPESAFFSLIGKSDRLSLAVLALCLLVAFAFAFIAARRVSLPLHRLGLALATLDPAEAPSSSEIAALKNRRDEIGSVATAYEGLTVRLAESFSSLRASIAEKEILLKELNHRVKNNLQIVASLISTQAGSSDDEATRDGLRRLQDRIQAMAYVHEDVYQAGGVDAVDMGRYFRHICESLSTDAASCAAGTAAFGCELSFDVEAEGISLDQDQAMPCGLIVNELVANSLKHAFAGRTKGRVLVTLLRKEGSGEDLILGVEDNGSGIGAGEGAAPPGAEEKKGGIGRILVEALAAQLGGKLEMTTGSGGTRFSVAFTSRHVPQKGRRPG